MTFTKERLTELSRRENVGAILGEEIAELARIALASLEAEAVYQYWCYTTVENSEGDQEEFWFWNDCDKDWFDRIDCKKRMLFTAPPAPVSVPDAYVRDERGRMMLNGRQEPRIGYGAGWNGYRAAMLQGAAGNSPVIPDGWKLVPIDPTKDMLRAGQSVVGFWLNTVHCYSKMLAAAPAAPQQEVTQALAKGMERYGDAMRELAKKEEK
ncbi:hypothetical protein [Enterobacter kobei]|uniref:hypothetical protein n=1 Tax=Enterobacter kobei TaxID=208224 RepID=UPI002003EC27|nr:hypothetical protein [Enterobacter kobei]MCK7031722.1 hypothetical protein [Enterobacter kobei]